jgi:hypothetical protein
MRSYSTTVTTDAAILVEPDDINRTVYIYASTDPIYLGGENVSTTNGLKVLEEITLSIVVPRNETIYAVSSEEANGGVAVSVLTPDPDDFDGGLYAEPEPEPEPEEEPTE